MADTEPIDASTEQEGSQDQELTFQQTSRSPEAITPREKLSDRDQLVIQVSGEAAIVLNKDDNQLKIYDENNEQVELSNADLMIANWEQIPPPADGGQWKVVQNEESIPPGATDYMILDDIPQDVRGLMQSRFADPDNTSNFFELPTESWKIDASHMTDIAISTNDDHVVIHQAGTPGIIAFETKDSGGNALPPRNWRRIDTATMLTDINAVSNTKLGESMGRLLESSEGDVRRTVKHLANGLTVVEANAGFTIFNDDTEVHQENLTVTGNLAEDPSQAGVLYFTAENSDRLQRLDTNSGSTADMLSLPKAYNNIKNLKLDSTGNFITFSSGGSFIVLDKDSLEEIGSIDFAYHGSLDDKDHVKAVDADGHLVTYEAALETIVQQKAAQRVEAAAAQAAKEADPDAMEADRVAALEEKYKHLSGTRDAQVEQLRSRIETTTDIAAFDTERARIDKIVDSMSADPEVREYMHLALDRVINEREQVVVTESFTNNLDSLQGIIDGDMDMTSYVQAAELRANLHALQGKVSDSELKTRMQELDGRFEEKDRQFRTEQNTMIRTHSQEIIARAQQALTNIKSKSALATWTEEELSSFRSELGSLKVLSIPENYGVIDSAMIQINKIISERREAIEEQAAEAGTTETDIRKIKIQSFRDEVEGLIDTIKDQGLQTREQVMTYLGGSTRYEDLQGRIAELLAGDPQAGREIRRKLGVDLALQIAVLERQANQTDTEDGRPMVMFGDVPFPIWQEKRKSKSEKKKRVELTFIKDEHATPTREGGKTVILGEIGVLEKNGKPDVTVRRIYQGKEKEDEFRSGTIEYRGIFAPGTIVTSEEFQDIKREYRDWQRGTIQTEFKKLQQEAQDYYQERPVVFHDGAEMTLSEAREKTAQIKEAGNPDNITRFFTPAVDGEAHDEWQQRYEELTENYAEYAAQHHVMLFEQLDELRNAPDTEVPNSNGYVPEWRSHWTKDEQTVHYLSEMARLANRQLKLQEGIINLVGHAGTGKDVLVKMFCHEANRSYFAFDSSKWTVESDLSEDILIEGGDTIKVPSSVLQAIETPGAVLYFNEFNAMPEPTQIFLHSLLDEKRALTLKTSGGRTINVDPSVILMSSMNPDYPGTYDPQFVTKSRMDYLPVDYSPLAKEDDPTQFSAAEALRIARGVDSLEGLTYDLNPDHNDFVKVWDKYINGVANGAPDLTQEQQFDIRTIQALVVFTNELRNAFIRKITKSRGTDLKMSQPMTGRQLARCAYDLSDWPESEKVGSGADPERAAKMFIQQELLTKISDRKEYDDVIQKLKTWTVPAHL